MSYEFDAETLDDIEAYAAQALNDLHDLQDRLRANAVHLPVEARGFLVSTADALDDIAHDYLDDELIMVAQQREDAAPNFAMADLDDYHARVGVR